jgi:hypothetical protein
MALGKSATLSQIKTAVCSDISKAHATNPMVSGALAWQSARFHWWSTSNGAWFTKAIVEGGACTK